jgi:hypothetical protein
VFAAENRELAPAVYLTKDANFVPQGGATLQMKLS